MADFTCSPGKVLTREETEAMLNYDEAGMARPDAYKDVVFDATSVTGSVYRCKTQQELDREGAARLDAERAATRQAAINDLKVQRREALAADMGVDPATLPLDVDPAQRIVLDGQDAAQEVDGGETRTSRRGK